MVRNRGWLVAGLLSVGLIGLASCKKEDKAPAASGSGDTKVDPKATAEKPAPPAGVPSTSKVSPTATGDDLSLLPVDSEVVMGLNFSQLQQSQLFKQFVEPLMMKGDFQTKLNEFKTQCGFDPLQAVKTVSIGMKGIGATKPDGVIVVHGAEKAKVMDCFEKMKAEAKKDAEVTRDGDIIIIKSNKGGDTVAFQFVNDTTALMVMGANATKDGIKAAAAGTSTLKSSAAFVEMYSKINIQDSMWLLMNGNSKAFDKAAAMGFKPKAVFGSLNVTDGLTLDLRMRLDSADQATQIAQMGKSQAAGAASMFDKLDIVSDGADVKVSIALSNAKLQSLIKQFGGLLGGMGGMGSMGGP
ncbi:MAG: hypothetical protein H6Q90_4614 [Deltaproteobacteria bacterium]|nr:hypothetical protein [Deltaproteobacteria bacterium]